jgi:hypothetical protein
METYSERLERECAEIEKTSPNIKKIVDEILKINRMSNMEFDYNIERKYLMYSNVKKISNCI